jgi:RNA polymerase sigma-70 factor (sigma-E family)
MGRAACWEIDVVMDWLTGRTTRRQFDRFVGEVTGGLVRTGYSMTFDLAETEDLVQETLLRVARRWDRVRSMDHPAAYARRILVNLVIDGGKERSRHNAELEAGGDGVLEASPDAAWSGPFRTIDIVSELQWALGTLPRRQRAVIVLRYWEDLSEADVAELLGCSVGTVKSTASRGLARLRQVMGEADAVPRATSSKPEGSPSSC